MLTTAVLATACASGTAADRPPQRVAVRTATPATAVVTCYDRDARPTTFHNPAEAWRAGTFGYCEGRVRGAPDRLQQRALTTAYGAASSRDPLRLGNLYGVCAVSGADNLTALRYAVPIWVQEMRGALMLCAEHPDRRLIRSMLARADIRNRLVAEHRIFWDGDYRVGVDIPAGTYFVRDTKTCYWQQTGRAGQILSNGWERNRARAEVKVDAGAYLFHSERCGEWQPVG